MPAAQRFNVRENSSHQSTANQLLMVCLQAWHTFGRLPDYHALGAVACIKGQSSRAPTYRSPFVSSIHHQLFLLLHDPSCPPLPPHPPRILTSCPFSTPLWNLTNVKQRKT